MKRIWMRAWLCVAGPCSIGFCVLGLSGVVGAQSYPSRLITEIVPFAAGGPTDVIARIKSA